MTRLLFLLFISLLGSVCCGQEMISRPFPFFYQLYSNEIFEVYQDREGYIWIGTTNGLARYDGNRTVTFRKDASSPTFPSDNAITYITDNTHFVWIGTHQGLTLFNKSTNAFSILADGHTSLLHINGVVTDYKDYVWVAAGGKVLLYSPTASLVASYRLHGNRDINVNHLFVDKQHHVWALTSGGLFLLDRKNNAFRKYPRLGKEDSPMVMCQDSIGHLWIGTWNEGIWLFDPKRKDNNCYKKMTVKITGTEQDDNMAYSMACDNTMGYIWSLSYNELHAMKYKNGKLEPVDISHVVDPHMMFTKIMVDREGNLWLGSYDMGYNIFFNRPGINNFTLPKLKEKLRWDANLLNIASDGQVTWLGQDRYGLILYNPATGQLSDQHTSFGQTDRIKPARDGGMWISQRDGCKMAKARRKGMTVEYTDNISLDKYIANPGIITDFSEDSEGNLWMLTDKSLFVRQHGTHGMMLAEAGTPLFSTLTTDRGESAWCFSGKQLYHMTLLSNSIRGARHSAIDALNEGESISHCCMDAYKRLWVTTSWGRVLKADKGNRHFTDMHLDPYIANGAILNITADNEHVWIVTIKKIVMLNNNGNVTREWNANEGGILIHEFRKNAIAQDGMGGLLVGGHGGYVHVTPYGIISKKENMTYSVTDVTVDDRSIFFNNKDQHEVNGTVYLKPNDSNIRIFFSNLRYSPRNATAVSYRLDGVDDKWVKGGSYCSAFYNHLPNGTYRFFIRYKLSDGSWSNPSLVLTVIQRPPFYLTWWAMLVYAVFLCLFAFFIVRNKQRIHRFIIKLHTMQRLYSGKVRVSIVGNQGTDEASAIDDNTFVEEVASTIKLHLSDSTFSADQLASLLSTSRSTLYRRVKAATGITPSDFIRQVKMQKACDLIEKQQLNISEIAYRVGFTNPKYFTKCFKDEFGITPSAYQRLHSGNPEKPDEG